MIVKLPRHNKQYHITRFGVEKITPIKFYLFVNNINKYEKLVNKYNLLLI